jgi:hypothetical protein
MEMFAGRTVVIATMHHKEKVIGPLLEKELGLSIVVPNNFNTDAFGTFTREIQRDGSQLNAARKKAKAAMDLMGLDLAVSSEGSFGPHPSIPFVLSGLELVLLIDRKHNVEIRGHHRTSKINVSSASVRSVEEALAVAKDWGFPEHGIIVRKSEHGNAGIHKDVDSFEKLESRVSEILRQPFTRTVFLETDMRAHKNPLRMEGIQKATEDLIKNIRSVCPRCNSPGFVVTEVQGGLPCERCGSPTDVPMLEIFSCAKCGHKESKKITAHNTFADAEHCERCNP